MLLLLMLLLFLSCLMATGVALLCQNHPRQQPTIFQKLSLDDVLVTQPTLSEGSVSSDKDCGRWCVGVEGCVMFTFTPTLQGGPGPCRLYGQGYNATQRQQQSPGARTYAVYGSTKCDEGYSRVCDRCLRFVSTPLTYSQAGQLCQTLGQGHLLVIRTLEELDCAMCFMKSYGLTTFWLWLAADDKATEGSYVWRDGTPLPRNSSLWASNQPNNHHASEDCMAARPTERGLHDTLCYVARHCLCQKDS